ncbi:MAG: hypothetical protein NVSMB62_15180 [Acidobacteriaceae bacterium]
MAVKAVGLAEAVAQQVGLCRDCGLRLFFVLGKLADEGEDLRDIGGGGGANLKHDPILVCASRNDSASRVFLSVRVRLSPSAV